MNAIEEAGAAYVKARRAYDEEKTNAVFTENKRATWAANGVAIPTEREWVAFVVAAKKRDAALRDLIAAVEQAEDAR